MRTSCRPLSRCVGVGQAARAVCGVMAGSPSLYNFRGRWLLNVAFASQLRLYKLVFGSVALFAEQDPSSANESILQPHLSGIIKTSLKVRTPLPLAALEAGGGGRARTLLIPASEHGRFGDLCAAFGDACQSERADDQQGARPGQLLFAAARTLPQYRRWQVRAAVQGTCGRAPSGAGVGVGQRLRAEA